nr:PEP-CTERM sorting domain-containing protein [uncultured Desulfobacter sp.]
MLNNKRKFKYGLVMICLAFCLQLGTKNVSAETICLNSLHNTAVWGDAGSWNWVPGDSFFITSNAVGINVGFEPGKVLFDSRVKFEIMAEYTTAGLYSGNFSITDLDDPSTVYLNAMFDDLKLASVDDLSLFFETSGVSNVSGDWMTTIFSDMTVSLINGSIDGSMGTRSSFLSLIRLEKESPVANPEPGTFFLFGFGMLGLACINRKKL